MAKRKNGNRKEAAERLVGILHGMTEHGEDLAGGPLELDAARVIIRGLDAAKQALAEALPPGFVLCRDMGRRERLCILNPETGVQVR